MLLVALTRIRIFDSHLLFYHLFSDALMTNKMSTNPLNSFSFDFMKSSDGLHDLHGEEGDLLLLAHMVTPCIPPLKAGLNIVIIYLRSITPLHFNNFNNF